MTFPSKHATLMTKVKFILSCILTLLVIGLLLAAVYFMYKRYWKDSQASSGNDSRKKKDKVMNKASTQRSLGFNVFNDEESKTTGDTQS